ncbi:MAG: hypothetical protein WAJ85_03770 [Candidatus Baltobacteraceae bacterium]|jgi:hypothetical protein
MSLHGLQCALAELFTTPAARERYARDPERFMRGFDLSERDRAQLEALAANAIASYASTLVRKRRAEAARLLPETRAALGAAFAAAFERWAQRTNLPDGPRRYAADAAGFCRHLLAERQNLPSGVRAVVAAELRALQPSRWAALRATFPGTAR